MSETPISLIDDKKSSQVTYNTDQIINNHETNRAFFEHAKNGNLYSPAPPEFDAISLKDEAPSLSETVWTQPNTGFVEPPEFATPPKSHEDSMKETVDRLTDPQCLIELGAISSKIVVSLRPLH